MTQINLLRQVKNLNYPDGTLINGKITRKVDGSGNMTVTLTGQTANLSASNPAYVVIGGVVRTITSALSVTINAGANYFNAGSAELATKEIDFFKYLTYNVAYGVGIIVARIPYGVTWNDFVSSETNFQSEKYGHRNVTTPVSTDPVVNIGRFNAILSAGPGYTWSLPATSVVINRPDFGLKEQESLNYKYHFEGNKVIMRRNLSITINSGSDNGDADLTTYPFTFTDINYHISTSGIYGQNFATYNEFPFVYYNIITTSSCNIGLITRNGNVSDSRTTTIKCRLEGKI